MFSCRHKPCTHVSQSAFVLQRHERRCKFNRMRYEANIGMTCSHLDTSRGQAKNQSKNQDYYEPELGEVYLSDDSVKRDEIDRASTTLGDNEKVEVLNDISSILLELRHVAGSKKVGRLLSLLQNKNFDIKAFKEHFSSVKDLETFQEKIQHTRAMNFGFQKGKVHGKLEDIEGVYYYRDPIHVLQRQFEKTKSITSFFRPVTLKNNDGERIYNHPFHTDFFRSIHDSVKRKVMCSQGSVFWNEDNKYIPESFIGALQMYTDKTVTSLSCNGAVAHPIHIVVLNVSIEDRQKLIDEGDTLIGFLPVQNYIAPHDSAYHKQDVNPTSRYDARRFRMDLLHSAIENILRGLYIACETGFRTAHDDNKDRICFPVLVSCCCDIPEMGDLSGVRSFPSNRCCPRCLSYIRNPDCYDIGKTRTVKEMVSIYDLCDYLRKEAQELSVAKEPAGATEKKKEVENKLKEYSLHPWTSFLLDCPLIQTSGALDMYRIFTYEGLHNLHLGVSRLIKTCTMKRFESSELLTCSKDVRDQKPFSTIRYHVLAGANSILAAIERESTESNFHIDFSGNEVTSGLNGIFTKEGLRGMLEGKDYRTLDMIFPIIGTYMDRWTGYEEEAPLTRIYTTYSDIVNRLMLYGARYSWTDSEIESFRKKIKNFQGMCVKVFKDNCDSGLFTMKFHLLRHLTEDIQDFSSLQYLMASPFESSHILWKRAYNISSRRKNTAMDESVSNIRSRMVLENRNSIKEGRKRRKNSHCSEVYVKPSRNSGLVRDGRTISLMDLIGCMTEVQNYIKKSNISTAQYVEDATCCVDVPTSVSNRLNECAFSVYKVLGIGGLQCFISMIRTEVRDSDLCCSTTVPPDHQILLKFVKSGHVYGGFVPLLKHFDRRNETIPLAVNKPFRKQRIFGSEHFAGRRRCSYVLLEGGEEQENPELWTAQVQCLFRLSIKNKETSSELSFVRYMEYTQPIDNVDEHLGCVMVRWTTDDEVDHTLHAPDSKDCQKVINIAPWYGLVPISSICGKVNVVRSNYAVHPFSQRTAWIYDRFYINRFYECEEKTEEIENK